MIKSLFLLAAILLSVSVMAHRDPPRLWDLAQRSKSVHRFSTLFTAQDVRGKLSTESGIDSAVAWCRDTGVTKVYVESFRDGYQAKEEALKHARDRFRAAGLEISGCITPTQVGKKSTGWNIIACYTDPKTQERIKSEFEFAARLFDEIMIDDFWFTDCACPECEAGRAARTVRIGSKTFPVSGDTWEDYRCELMVRLSREYALAAAKQVNPRVKLIIKYPQWYDRFHERGYEVSRESADFDRIWVGTETRDYDDKQWGGTPQYEAYFIMRWLGGIGGKKCGGGWYDPYGTTENTYIEQARQTILGGARESLLFCYGSLLQSTGPQNVAALRREIPELLQVARKIKERKPIGIAAYKPPNSHPGKEPRIFDFVGMLGLPLVPCHEFPSSAKAAFFSMHALKDPDLIPRLGRFLDSGRPALITDGLADALGTKLDLSRSNVRILKAGGDPKSLLALSEPELNDLRIPLLKPFGAQFEAPNRVALYLFSDGSHVVENFNDSLVGARINDRTLSLAPRDWACEWAARKSRGQIEP